MEDLRSRVTEECQELDKLSNDFEEKQQLEKMLREQWNTIRKEIVKFDLTQLENARRLRDQTFAEYSEIRN